MKVTRKLFCLITLALITMGIQISYVAWIPTLAAGLQSPNVRLFKNHAVITSSCSDDYCVYLPIVLNEVPEIDEPPCRWPHNIGQNVYISYKWGTRLQTPGTLWRNAFESGISEWNNAPIFPYYYFTTTSENVINTYDLAGDDRRGFTRITCIGTETGKVEIFGNIYYDMQAGWYTVNQRRGIATHEVGHGQSIGHIPNNYTSTALMYLGPVPLSFWNTTYIPQPPDIALVNQIYR